MRSHVLYVVPYPCVFSQKQINTIKMHFMYMSVGLVVFICLSVCKQSHYFACRWMISHLILWLMLGDVL